MIEAVDLPGGEGVSVGVQRRRRPEELLDPVPASADSAQWSLEVSVFGDDLAGEYVEGRPGARFVYLSWTREGEMFRRAKLMLDGIPPTVLADAVRAERLVARLALTDDRGGPLCAAVRPPLVRWTAD